jgi:SAM-dependent methyltransferase
MEDRTKLIPFFDDCLKMYSPDDSMVVAWASRESQFLRFEVLSQIATFENCSILDVGCGVGDYIGFIEESDLNVDYLGIDINSGMIRASKEKYPGRTFETKDIRDVHDQVDYVIASGPFNIQLSDNKSYLETMVRRMMSLAKKGVSFNLLSSLAPYALRYGGLHYYDPCAVFKFCYEEFGKVSIRHDYLEHDFTVYIYH